MLPSTVQQLAVLVAMVLPGIFYQAVADRLRGPHASEQEPQNRFLRSVAISGLLDALYAVAAGPWLARLLTGDGGPLAGVLRHPRQAGLAVLLLVVLVPSAAAWAASALHRRRERAHYEPTPTAWDFLFADREPCFVRIRLKGGRWVGGWLGPRSAVSAFPQPQDVYLESQWRLSGDGTFLGRVAGTAGVYVKGSEIEVLELVAPPEPARAAVPEARREQGDGSGRDEGTAPAQA
ncbi:DUF6338 family protein [Kitasatospora cheerisanensis]|uniref:Uncharacterized protein n=1 Tax=Kitasatospora cheerisanensis KCTC 2395 TaxID=1348663 RepID=A0A066Z1Q1_9ACTN|nr:DUF6338 family protein [Kitasatospora cheerisanensis]KDN87447.1 hypothetical protein KCH_08190 [Kitasatospora cheerisanensis KCTC 2395]